MKIKREKQELEMQVSQVKINKSIVEVEPWFLLYFKRTSPVL
jgi:hypothetical protein